MCIHMQKEHIRMLKILLSMSEFGGLWKQQNNSACTENDSNGQLCGWWSLTEEEEEVVPLFYGQPTVWHLSCFGYAAVPFSVTPHSRPTHWWIRELCHWFLLHIVNHLLLPHWSEKVCAPDGSKCVPHISAIYNIGTMIVKEMCCQFLL